MKYLIATLLLFATSCDLCGDTNYKIEDNGHTLSAHGYDDKFVYDGEYCTVVSYTWFCAHHDGGNCEYVDLTFMSCPELDGGSGWYLDSVFTGECI